MTIEEYERRALELGIDRGSFAPNAKFPADPQSVVAAYRNGVEPAIDYSITSKLKPPFEDLSHMNPPKRGINPWHNEEFKKQWIAKRMATLARKAAGK